MEGSGCRGEFNFLVINSDFLPPVFFFLEILCFYPFLFQNFWSSHSLEECFSHVYCYVVLECVSIGAFIGVSHGGI